MYNLQFLLGFGTALLVTTKQGHSILKIADEAVNKVTGIAIDTVKESMPSTVEIIEKAAGVMELKKEEEETE